MTHRLEIIYDRPYPEQICPHRGDQSPVEGVVLRVNNEHLIFDGESRLSGVSEHTLIRDLTEIRAIVHNCCDAERLYLTHERAYGNVMGPPFTPYVIVPWKKLSKEQRVMWEEFARLLAK